MTDYQQLIATAKWRPIKSTINGSIDPNWLHWIRSQDSLTNMLNVFSNNTMRVNVISESWSKPSIYEAKKLGISTSKWAFIREVELLCNDQIMVFARSVIPRDVYNNNKFTLGRLGTQPLGHLLFRHALQRNRLRDVCLPQPEDSKNNFYGRSTYYAYNDGEILVQEFFVNSALVSKSTQTD